MNGVVGWGVGCVSGLDGIEICSIITTCLFTLASFIVFVCMQYVVTTPLWFHSLQNSPAVLQHLVRFRRYGISYNAIVFDRAYILYLVPYPSPAGLECRSMVNFRAVGMPQANAVLCHCVLLLGR